MQNSVLKYINKKTKQEVSMENFDVNQGSTSITEEVVPADSAIHNIPESIEGYENFKTFFENFSISINAIKELLSSNDGEFYGMCDSPILIDYVVLKQGREKTESSLKMIIDYFTSYTTTGVPSINHEDSPYVDFLEEVGGKVVFAPMPYLTGDDKRLHGFYFLKEDLENNLLLAILDDIESVDVNNCSIVLNGFKKIVEEKETFFDKISPLLTNLVAVWEEVIKKITVDENIEDIDSLLRGIDSSRILIDYAIKVISFLKKNQTPVQIDNN